MVPELVRNPLKQYLGTKRSKESHIPFPDLFDRWQDREAPQALLLYSRTRKACPCKA